MFHAGGRDMTMRADFAKRTQEAVFSRSVVERTRSCTNDFRVLRAGPC
jgi:hypothetical protein